MISQFTYRSFNYYYYLLQMFDLCLLPY